MIDTLRLADTVTKAAFADESALLSPHNQRRSEPRYAPTADRAWVQWWEDGDYFGRSAKLVNVSRHGAMLVGTMELPSNHAIRLFLEDFSYQHGIDAAVISMVIGSKGLHQLHLVFNEACSDIFLDAAIRGYESRQAIAHSRF